MVAHADPKKIVMNLRVNRGHASAQQLKQVSVDPDGDNTHAPTSVYEVMAQREVCGALDKAPNVPPRNPCLIKKMQVDLVFLDDPIALRATDVPSKYPLLIPFRSKNTQEVWNASRHARVGVLRPPPGIQMDGGRRWKNEAWAELRPEPRINLQL